MRLLWIKTELLHPVDKGGRIRTYGMLRELSRRHHVTYLALDDGAAAPDAVERSSEYCQALVRVPWRGAQRFSLGFYRDLLLNLVSPLPYAIQKYRSDHLRAEIERLVAEREIDVVICDFLAPSVNVPEGLACPAVLFQHNVEAVIWRRHYEVARNPLRRAYFHRQWLKMRAFERAECRRYDQVIAVSPRDAEVMEQEYGLEHVASVPTGVDTDYFRPSGQPSPQPNRLVFTGSMDWLPNVDGIRYFIEQILPRIKETVPDVSLTIVGRNPPPDLQELVGRHPALSLTGFVDDVRPFMDEAAVYIVPLRIGGGTRLKIYEAMAMEKAIVSTSIGAEGLPVENGLDLVLSDTPEDFAASVIQLLRDPSRTHAIGTRAAARVREKFGWGGVAAAFERICEESLRHPRSSGRSSP